MAQEDPAYIAARELDTTLQKLRNDLCECKAKADAGAKKSAAPGGTVHVFALVLLAFAAFWLLSVRSGHR